MTAMLTTKDLQETHERRPLDHLSHGRDRQASGHQGRPPVALPGRGDRDLAGRRRHDPKPASAAAEEAVVGDLVDMLLPGVTKPLADLLGSIFGVMVLITDLDGQPLVEPANPCGLFQVRPRPSHHQPAVRRDLARARRRPGSTPTLSAYPPGL